ncbi:MAG: lipopolysaccharide kinase InaA family protein [Kiritimatiellia bacterium]
MKTAYAAPDVMALFPQSADAAFWLDGEIGTLLSIGPGGRELRRVEAGGRVFFLKRSGRESLLKHWFSILHGGRPLSGALREKRMLEQLRARGFAAMEPAAWGQERLPGFRARGFLLVRKVNGEELAELFDKSPGLRKRELMTAAGHLVGRLHARGFLQPVRLKDLILSGGELVLIDRETSKPWPGLFSRRRAAKALARSLRRMHRDGHRPGAGSLYAFLQGYRQGVSEKCIINPLKLAAQVCAELRKTN